MIADPFNYALLEWADATIAAHHTVHLAHSSDISAYLSRHEKSLWVMGSQAKQYSDWKFVYQQMSTPVTKK